MKQRLNNLLDATEADRGSIGGAFTGYVQGVVDIALLPSYLQHRFSKTENKDSWFHKKSITEIIKKYANQVHIKGQSSFNVIVPKDYIEAKMDENPNGARFEVNYALAARAARPLGQIITPFLAVYDWMDGSPQGAGYVAITITANLLFLGAKSIKNKTSSRQTT